MIIDLSVVTSVALLALRIIVAVIFFSSGKSHALHPEERGKQIGMSKTSTRILGVVEMAGAVSIAFGIYIQIGAALVNLTMAGAIYKKIAVWNTGFYSDEGFGWHYDFLLLCANLVFLTEGGRLVLIG